MSRIKLEDRVARAADLLFAEIDGEAVALNAERGVCYGLNSVGLRVLKLIEPSASVADVLDRLVGEYDVEPERCQREVMALLGDLEAEGLVVIQTALRAP